MAVTTRTLRHFGNIFQNQENLGLDRFAGMGDTIAAFRSSRFNALRNDQPVDLNVDQAVTSPGLTIGRSAAAAGGGGFDALAILSGDNVLSAGEVAIVSYETDTSVPASPDGLRFVLLTGIAQGTVIYITDRAWNGSAFTNAAGEGTYTYTAPTALAAGTVITLSHAQLATGGITLSNAGETLYMYQGAADTPTHFLFAADVADGNITFTGNLTGTGLTNGVNAVAVAQDNAVYVGAPTGIQQTQILSISSNTSWYGLDLDDNAATTGFTEVIDTVVQNPFFDGHDMVMISGFRGGGQSDGILRIGEENNAQTAVNVARMFRDNAAFTGVEDISFDLENGFFFFLDTNGNAVNRIMRGNITDLVSGNQTPTFTQIFATDGFGELITGIEVDRAANKIYWWDGNFIGDYEGGWQLNSINYDGTGLTQVALLDTENTQGSTIGSTGGVGDWALDIPHGFAYAVNSRGQVDGFGNLTLEQNHIVRVNLSTGVITVLALDAADPRSNQGPGNIYNNGRLNANEGQIIALDVDQNTGIVYFVTQPESSTGNGGVWSYNPATDDLQELWNQPAPNAFNTLQTFPTSNMVQIEVDEIGGRLFITTNPDSDHENDATPGVNEHDASIHVLAIGAALGTAPTRFVRVYEPTALGAPRGMEIDYDSNVSVTTSNATYTESTNLPNSPAGPVITPYTNTTITDPDQTMIYGATVAITNGFVSGDTLSFTNSGGITGTYTAATGVLVFTGLASLAAYQTVLNSVRYTNAGDNPTDYGNSQSRTLSVTAFDGLTHSDLANVSITVVGINDAPVNTVPGAAATTNEDSALVLTGMSVADPDADPANQDIRVTLSVNHGTITIFTGAPGGVQVSDVTGNGTGTVVITATQNQINATFAHATGVTYLNTLDFNGADLLTITTNDLGLNGNDPGLSGTGTSEQDQDTRAINITPVNDAPVVAGDGTEDSLTIFEDQPSPTGQTVSSLFLAQFTDQKDNQVPNGGVSVANTFIGVAVVGNASSGVTGQWQYLNGAVWTDIGTASLGAAKLFNDETQFRFNPAFNYNGAEPLLTIRLIDSSGGASVTDAQVVDISAVGATGGTSRYSAGSVVLGGTILPVNDAPTSTNLNGDNATWTENGAAVTLDTGTAATIADIDSPNFDTGTLTVAIASPLAQDGLFIGTVGTVTTGAGTVSVGGIQIGTFTGGGYGGGPLVITFDADATPAAVQELVRAIQYNNNAGDSPTAGPRTVNWTLVDGDGTANMGTDTLNVTTTVNVVAVNDAPQGTDAAITLNEDGSRILAAADFGFSDPAEGDNFAGVVITTLPTNGVLLLNGVPVTVAGTFVTAAQISANQLVFQPDANENGTPYATFTFQVRDDGGLLNGGIDTDQSPNTLTFNVNPVNDAPTSTNLNGDAATYAEGSPFALLDVGSNATVADIDSANFDGGTLTVSITGGLVAAEDQLVLTNTGTVTFTANTVSVGGTQIATYTGGGAGGGNLVFTFDADATPATVAILIHAIGYTNSDLTSPTGGIRTIGWTLVDGDGIALGGSDTLNLSSTVEVINVNSAPQGTDAAITLNEDGSRILAAADFGFSDPAEGDNFAGVVITTLPTNGVLLLNGVPVTVAGTFVTAAQISANQLVFQPDANENGTPYATFTFQVRDDGGIANGGQDTDQSPNTLTFNVNSVNDAPTSTNLNGDAAIYIEGSAAVLLDVGSNATIADIDSADFDTGSLTVALTGGVVAQDGLFIETAGGITTGAGTVSFMGTQIGTFTGGGYGGGPLVFTFDADATPAAVQALVHAISYNNNGGASPTAGLRTVTWTLVDGDGVALGGADTLSVTSTIDVQAINDAPTGTDAAFTINEDSTYTFAASSFGFGDINGDQFAGVVVTTIPVPGTLFYDADGAGAGAPVAVTAGQFISAADIALGKLFYTPVLNGNGVPFSSFTFQVRDNGGIGNGGQDTDQSPNTVTFNVTAVNDAPTNTVPGGQTINEDASLTLSTGNGNAISVTDVDATTLSVTLSVAHGTLTIASTLGLTFSGGSDGTADATMTFSGTAAAINAALGAGLTYNPNANFNGSDAISVVTTDGGQTGTGPVGTDSDSISVSITAINDAPVVIGDGTESATTINEDTPGAGQTIQALFAGQYSDAADNQIPNGGASSPGQFSGIAVTANGSSAATGQWQYFSGGVWTDIGAASDAAAKLLGDPFVTLIRFNPALNYNGPAPTLTVHLIDNSLPFGIVNGQVVNISGPGATGGTTAYSTGTVVLSQDITAVNDAPVNTVPGTQTINEDASFTLSTGNGNAISVVDVDATTVSVTLSVAHGTLTIASTLGLTFSGGSDGTNDATMTFSGTAAAINAALGAGLTYNPTANYNGPDAISVVTTDAGQTGTGPVGTDTDTVNITINSVNDAPSGANNTLTGSEDDPLVLTAADFGFTDPIDGNAFLAVIIDTFPANGTLFLDVDGPGGNPPVNLSTLGPGVFVNVSDINLGRLYFQPDADEYGVGYAQFTFRVQDDGGMLNGGIDRDPTANTIFINIEPDNLPPVVDLNGAAPGIDYTTTFVEDGPPLAIGSGVLVSDPDSGLGDMIESATITLTDRVAGDAMGLMGPLPPGIVSVTTSLPGSITIQITGPGTGAQYQALIQSIAYWTTNQDPTVGGTDPSRTITVVVNDGTISSAVATTTVNITAVDDLPIAQPDAFTITESGTIVGGNLFANNGSGADSDPDGPPLAISAVNGSAAAVNNTISLGSGALLTVNSNGTFNYDPNGAFLPTPTPGSGASNTPAHDGFTYTLAGGNTVNVSITLTGLDTNDILLGTAGTDILIGGNGNDTYYVENSADQVVETAGQGFDAVYTSVNYTLAPGSEVEWLSADAVYGTNALNLTGNGIANTILGNQGINVLNGAGGADTLVGYGGNDVYYVDNAGDLIVEEAGGGFDAVYTDVSYTLTAGSAVEWLAAATVYGTDALSLTGNEFANTILGNQGNNVLTGGGGADVLVGYGGNDVYYVDNASDFIIEAANSGFDAVYTNVSYTLNAGAEVEWLSTDATYGTAAINLTGNELANIILGNQGSNIITGGGGADVLVGYGGNDTYYVNSASAQVLESTGGGNDSVYASTSYTLGAGQEIEFLSADNFSSTSPLSLTGNELANTIYGNDGANVLDGKGGNDSLIGLGGADMFAFTTALGASNVDLVFGFTQGVDKIGLDDAIFTGIGGLGALNANAFHTGTGAHDLDDRIIYNSATGQLFFDADGTGVGLAVQFATLSPGLALTASDFQVI
jgi:Ca2+-binding RTX toxin-like protein